MALKGVIFDMDGTITVPFIDWKTLRATIGAPPEKTILEHIESLPPDRAVWANDILLQTEREACARAGVNDGIGDLLDYLESKGIRTALVTNNHREAMQTVLERHRLRFDIALSRDDGELKPSGDLIEKALKALGLLAAETVAIGDGRYDIEACRRVGVRCIYLTHGTPDLEHTPAVETLVDALALLQSGDLSD